MCSGGRVCGRANARSSDATVGWCAGNQLYVMGSNANGQLGSAVSGSNVPIPVGSGIWPSGTVTIVAAGLQHTAVVAGVELCIAQLGNWAGWCTSLSLLLLFFCCYDPPPTLFDGPCRWPVVHHGPKHEWTAGHWRHQRSGIPSQLPPPFPPPTGRTERGIGPSPAVWIACCHHDNQFLLPSQLADLWRAVLRHGIPPPPAFGGDGLPSTATAPHWWSLRAGAMPPSSPWQPVTSTPLWL